MDKENNNKSKKKPKRANVNGFDGIGGELTTSRLKSLAKNKVDGDWRRDKEIKLKYTLIKRTWTYVFQGNSHEMVQTHLAPLGMVKYLQNVLSLEKCLNYDVLPADIKDKIPVEKDSYNKKNMTIKCENSGDQGFQKFNWLYCTVCMNTLLPFVLSTYKQHLPDAAKIEDVINEWDVIWTKDESIANYIDICGCVLPNQAEIIAMPNNRKFILRPQEHKSKIHEKILPGILSNSRKRQHDSDDQPEITFSKKSSNILRADKNGNLSTSETETFKAKKNDKNVTLSFTKKARPPKFMHVGQMLDPKMSLTDIPRSPCEEFAQNNCLSSILFGVNHNVSQRTTVQIYNHTQSSISNYHETHLAGIVLDGKKFESARKICLNEHNIVNFEKAILNTFRESDGTAMNYSPYSVLRGPFSKYYSIFHDGIQKFGMELNGVMARALNENLNIVNVPWALTKIPGGSLDSGKLVSQILAVVNRIVTYGVKSFEPASKSILHRYESHFPDAICPTLPPIFSCCTLTDFDIENKAIKMRFENWPVALVADGCSVNTKAGKDLFNRYGLISPTTRCSGHAASGSIKRLASSKTMCVEEVVTFADGLRPVLRHFQQSGKSTSFLNEALTMLEMKNINVLTWCPTRMANLLDASRRTVSLLFPLCDVLSTCDIKVEERAYFMSPTCLAILHLMSDLQVL